MDINLLLIRVALSQKQTLGVLSPMQMICSVKYQVTQERSLLVVHTVLFVIQMFPKRSFMTFGILSNIKLYGKGLLKTKKKMAHTILSMLQLSQF